MTKRRVSSARGAATRPPPRDGRPKNRLLAALPAHEFQRLASHLQTIPITVKQVLLKRGEPIRHVFFPNGGVCSVTAAMTNGAAVEVATVGVEGMLGISAMFGRQGMPGDCMVQVPDTNAERMPIDAFERERDRHGALEDALQRYTQGFLTLMMQSTACVALHPVQQRCCRWLLMTHDRLGANQFTLSQGFLAMMLGATRPTVTVVARSLQEAGLIRYTHARMGPAALAAEATMPHGHTHASQEASWARPMPLGTHRCGKALRGSDEGRAEGAMGDLLLWLLGVLFLAFLARGD